MGFTVKLILVIHPTLFVYVITTEPDETALTFPVLLTVATAVFDELHALVTAGVGEPVSWVEDPSQSVLFPVIEGRALTVIVEVTEQLLLFI